MYTIAMAIVTSNTMWTLVAIGGLFGSTSLQAHGQHKEVTVPVTEKEEAL